MNLGEGMLVSFVPTVCELAILQVLYGSMYKENAALKRRVICFILFFLVQYPNVFFNDYYGFFDEISILRYIWTFLLYALYLKAVFKGGFLSHCLPAAAVFVFISLIIEIILWLIADLIGLVPTVIRHTLWQVLIFQAILFSSEYGAAKLVGRLNITAGYPRKMTKKMWLTSVGYLAVTTVFWIGLVNFLGESFRTGNFGITGILSIIVCFIVSLLFIKSSMDIMRESECREWEINEQKTELKYQKLYNSSMEAMLFEVSRFRHNYSNTLAVLKGFADSGDFERLKKYINELCQKQHIAFADNRSTLTQIKNGAVAGLLASKMLMAEKSEVVFKLSVNGELDSVNMPLMELCEVLGILLDNAVEAAAESAGKYVRVEIDAAGSGTVFRIENSVDKKPDIRRLFEKGYTTKSDGHGLGLHIAENILKKSASASLNTFSDDERVLQELSVM